VKSLRAQFEQKVQNGSTRSLLTPEQFLKEQKLLAEKQIQEMILARKKAATFNMAMRHLELKQAAAAAAAAASSSSTSKTSTAPLQQTDDATRQKLRKEARKLSIAMRDPPANFMATSSSTSSPITANNKSASPSREGNSSGTGEAGENNVVGQKERRATHLLLGKLYSLLKGS
jgi:hypothetical protein